MGCAGSSPREPPPEPTPQPVVRRRGSYERTESQQTALEQLRGLQRAVVAKAKAARR